MVVNKIIKQMSEIGFSENESKAYVSLVRSHPATAYEVAKASGIPTSKIYEVLARLTEKEVVQPVEEGGKKKFVPLSPEEFLNMYQNSVNRTIVSLKSDLSDLETTGDVSYIWNIRKYESLIEKAIRMITEAENEVLVSGWPQDLAFLKNVLQERESEGLKIACINFGDSTIDIGQIFQHPIDDTIYSEKGGRGLVIVSDGEEAMMGTVYDNDSVEGAWSKNNGYVALAEDYIKHDVYIMKIVKRFDAQLLERFGENYVKLRDVFSDEEEQ